MKFVTIEATRKSGEKVTAEVVDPQTLKELVQVYGEERPFSLGRIEYLKKAQKKLLSGRSRKIVVKLDDLSTKQQELLRQAGLL